MTFACKLLKRPALYLSSFEFRKSKFWYYTTYCLSKKEISLHLQMSWITLQQDSYDILPPNDDGVKERVTSSHTILLYLAEDFTAGATRFFPSGNYYDPAEAVDIRHVIKHIIS